MLRPGLWAEEHRPARQPPKYRFAVPKAAAVCSLSWQQKGTLNCLETWWDLIVSLQFSSFVALGTAKMLQDGKDTNHIPLLGV